MVHWVIISDQRSCTSLIWLTHTSYGDNKLKNENLNSPIEGFKQPLKEFFPDEEPVTFFTKEISLKGSLYLEDLSFSSSKLEEILSYAVEMNYIVHLSEKGTLILDPNFFSGDYKWLCTIENMVFLVH